MRKRLGIGLLAAMIAISLVVAARHELLRFALQEGAGLATGDTASIAHVHLDRDEIAVGGVRIERRRSPVASKRGASSVRYLAPRFACPAAAIGLGCSASTSIGAKLTLIRFRDGSFNFAIPQGAPATRAAARSIPVPLRFTLRVRDAQLELREPYAYDPSAKVIRVHGIDVDASIDTAQTTQYRATRGVCRSGASSRSRSPGTSTRGAGYAMHHATARHFPLRALANYFADTAVVRVLGGNAHELRRAHLCSGVTPEVSPAYHVSLRLDVDGGRLALQSLAAPVEQMRARVQLVDNAFFVRDAHGVARGHSPDVDGRRVRLRPAALTGQRAAGLGRLGARRPLGLRRAFAFRARSADLGRCDPGRARRTARSTIPSSSRAWTRRRLAIEIFPSSSLHAAVVYHSNVVALVPLSVSYSGLALAVHGTLGLGTHVRSRFARAPDRRGRPPAVPR